MDARLRSVGGRLKARFAAGRHSTAVAALALSKLPKGAWVKLTCCGRGCPPGSTTVGAHRGRAHLTSLFRRRRLCPGAVISLRVTAKNRAGRLIKFKVRAGKKPKRTEKRLG